MTSEENASAVPPQGQPQLQQPIHSPLHAAMNMADLVRSSLNQATSLSSSSSSTNHNDDETKQQQQQQQAAFTPGIVEGAAAGIGTMLVLTPVRWLLLRAVGQRTLGMLPDLVVTTGQIMVSANAGLYYGSLYGSHHYLSTFNSIPVAAVSPTVDGICQESSQRFGAFYNQILMKKEKEERNQHQQQPSSSSSWNPDEIVLAEFAKAMKLCRERDALKAQEKEDPGNKASTRPNDKISWWRR